MLRTQDALLDAIQRIDAGSTFDAQSFPDDAGVARELPNAEEGGEACSCGCGCGCGCARVSDSVWVEGYEHTCYPVKV